MGDATVKVFDHSGTEVAAVDITNFVDCNDGVVTDAELRRAVGSLETHLNEGNIKISPDYFVQVRERGGLFGLTGKRGRREVRAAQLGGHDGEGKPKGLARFFVQPSGITSTGPSSSASGAPSSSTSAKPASSASVTTPLSAGSASPAASTAPVGPASAGPAAPTLSPPVLGSPAEQFLDCVKKATSTSDFLKRLTQSNIPNIVDQKVIDEWKNRPILLDGAKNILNDPAVDETIGDILKKENPKSGGQMAASFAQISSAIRHVSEPEWIRKKIDHLVPKTGSKAEEIQARLDELREFQTEMARPDFTEKTALTPLKVRLITKIMKAYFKAIKKDVKWEDADTYRAIALYKNVVAAYTHYKASQLQEQKATK